MPKLILTGDADRMIAPRMAARLYAAAREPKRLTLIRGGHHEDLATIDPTTYFHALNDFLDSVEHIAPRRPRP